MLHISRQSARRGFSLTELSIVLGVAGIILGAIWTAAGNSRTVQKNNDAVSELQAVVQNIQPIMEGRTFPLGVLADATLTMINAGVIPRGFVIGATAGNPWATAGGNFRVWQNPTAPASNVFRVSFYNVTQQGCITLLLQGTSCQGGMPGCPTKVGTGGSAGLPTPPTAIHSCQVNQNNCPIAAGGELFTPGLGWVNMTVPLATLLCSPPTNTYPVGVPNSVEFDYTL